jgi:predicted ATPase
MSHEIPHQIPAAQLVAQPQRFIVAGGPGAGKSTLLRALADLGEICYDEVSRALIREQSAQGGRWLPWLDLAGFAAECSRRMRQQLTQSTTEQRTFFDRGPPDLIGYLRHGGLTPPPTLSHAARAYTPLVLFAPPWADIFVNDTERPQSYQESVALSTQVRRAYAECGFRIVELVRGPIEQRVQQVRQQLQDYSSTQPPPAHHHHRPAGASWGA